MDDEYIAIRFSGTTTKLTPKEWIDAALVYKRNKEVDILRKALDTITLFLKDVYYAHLEYDFNSPNSIALDVSPERSELFVNAHMRDGKKIEIESEQWDWDSIEFEDVLLDFAKQLERLQSEK